MRDPDARQEGNTAQISVSIRFFTLADSRTRNCLTQMINVIFVTHEILVGRVDEVPGRATDSSTTRVYWGSGNCERLKKGNFEFGCHSCVCLRSWLYCLSANRPFFKKDFHSLLNQLDSFPHGSHK